jgi:DNA-directed RNA polymerase specialized sigma24 family protein
MNSRFGYGTWRGNTFNEYLAIRRLLAEKDKRDNVQYVSWEDLDNLSERGFEDNKLESKEYLIGRVKEALKFIPRNQKYAIRENCFNGKPHRKIASKLGVSHTTIENDKNRGINEIREMIGDEASL